MTEKTMIQFEHVSKVYGDKTVVNDINLTIENGEFITILGTSGSGKTTMLKMINKLIEPTSGTIFFAGQDIEQMDSVSLRRQIGYVVQQIGLFPHMTVAENIATVPKLLGWDKERIENRVGELLDLVQLPAADYGERYPSELSGGQQQRLCIARALAVQPEVLLMDEPTSALDPISTLKIEDLALELKQNYTIVIVTHNMQQAVRISDKTAFFLLGEVVEFNDTDSLFSNPQEKKTEDYITGRFG